MDYKAIGNAAFASGQYTEAISAYSEGIEHDKSSAVLYSNRSAAYLSRNHPGDALFALNDATASLRLDKTFVKGYHRKASALIALKEFEQALQVVSEGLKIDPSNSSLRDCFQTAQTAFSLYKQSKMHDHTKEKENNQVLESKKEEPKGEEDILDAFFKELDEVKEPEKNSSIASVSTTDPNPVSIDAEASSELPLQNTLQPPAVGVRDIQVHGFNVEELKRMALASVNGVVLRPTYGHILANMTTFDVDAQSRELLAQKLGTGKEEINRIVCKNHEWINLNPFEVLSLPYTATDEDIRTRFKKLSALVHPDRHPEDADRASTAFQELKRAHDCLVTHTDATLLSRRNIVVGTLHQTTLRAKKEYKKLNSSSSMQHTHTLLSLQEFITRETRKAFAEMEQRKRNYETRLKEHARREVEEQFEQQEEARLRREIEEEWDTKREDRVDSWRSFQSGHSAFEAGSGLINLESKKRTLNSSNIPLEEEGEAGEKKKRKLSSADHTTTTSTI
jgi:DnaJ homolog subfamily C member 8